jgi:purine nucleosidase
LRAAPDDGLTICALGPLSNIAMALRLAPDIGPHIREIVVMGGAMGLGNITPAAEFNFHVDPHAAAIVLGAGWPVTLFGLHATLQAIATAADLVSIAALGTATGRSVHSMLTRPRASGLGGAHHPLHDPCVIAWLLWPELFSGRDCHVAIELADSVRGRSTIDWNGRLKRAPNAFVVDRIEREMFFARLIDALGSLP